MAGIAEVTRRGWIAAGLLLVFTSVASAGPFDELPEARWAKLREVERYQLNIAEKLYKADNFKAAAAEYEKYLKLYDRSEAAAYAQLKWSHCQVKLRFLNTAIKDGYQSVIDYFPDTPEAVSSAYLIGETYKALGDLRAAKKAYGNVLEENGKQLVGILARRDLIEMAQQEKDDPRRLELLKELTFEAERKDSTAVNVCTAAARQLCQHEFVQGNFAEGMKALATSCQPDDLPSHLMHPSIGRLPYIIGNLVGQEDMAVKKTGERLADAGIAYLRDQVVGDLKDEKRKPRAVQCWNYIAQLEAYAKRPDRQREVYEQMLQTLGPRDDVLGQLAAWHKAHGSRDEARRVYLRFQDKIEGQNQVALSYREEKKWNEAVAVYRKMAGEVEKGAVWINQVALTYRQAGQPDQAIAVYRELIQTDVAQAPEYHWQIAETLYNANRWKDALAAYRGTERPPTSYYRMAECHRQLKQYPDAILLFQHIAGNYPGSAPDALWRLGLVQEEAGQTEPAIASFKRLCDRYPKTGEASNAHNRLNEKYKIKVTLGGAKE
jgi:tetratricopeptide (TPR) repeat protein